MDKYLKDIGRKEKEMGKVDLKNKVKVQKEFGHKINLKEFFDLDF